MSLRLYMDHHIHGAITRGLRRRGVDVLTAEEDNSKGLSDPDLLSRASAQGRVLVSQDEDLLAEAARRQHAGERFAGLIYSHQLEVTIGDCVEELELIAKAYEPANIAQRVEFVPLR